MTPFDRRFSIIMKWCIAILVILLGAGLLLIG